MIEGESRTPGDTGVEDALPARVRITVRQVNRRGKVVPGGASWQVTLGGVKLGHVVQTLKHLLREAGWL